MPERPAGFRVLSFRDWLADLIRDAGHQDVAQVEPYSDAAITVGLTVTLHSGARLFLQCVRTSPPGGDPDHADYQIPPGRLQ